MILYRLRCSKGHEFESWFKDSKTYERQEKKSLIGCAVCGDAKVARALMAPRLGKGSKKPDVEMPAAAAAPAPAPSPEQQQMAAMAKHMPKELREAYLAVAPHPENLQSFFDKCVQRMRSFKDIPEDAIRGVAAPTLVIVGDADVMRPEHAVEGFRLLPHAQLGVLPGTDHMKVMTRAEWIVPMVVEFLDAPTQRTK